MDELPLTCDQCDALVAKVMEKLAKKASAEHGEISVLDLNPSITEHHVLRRSVVQAAYMLGALEMQQSERERFRDVLADACLAAEIPDSKYESLLIALKA